MELYQQLNSRHVHRYTQPVIFGTGGEIDGVEYTAAMDGYFSPADLIGAIDKADTDEPVVIITNNGYWAPATDDQDEFTFRPGSGIMDVLNKEALTQYLTRSQIVVTPEGPQEREITFTTGEAGMRALEQYVSNAREIELISPELMQELVDYQPERIPVHTVEMQSRRLRRRPPTPMNGTGLWNQLRRGEELPNSVTTTRTFLSEEEVIAYLDSLDQEVTTNINTIIDEENTDNV